MRTPPDGEIVEGQQGIDGRSVSVAVDVHGMERILPAEEHLQVDRRLVRLGEPSNTLYVKPSGPP